MDRLMNVTTVLSILMLIMVLVFNVSARVLGQRLTKHFTGRTS